jgi:signal transduction histidine kinase
MLAIAVLIALPRSGKKEAEKPQPVKAPAPVKQLSKNELNAEKIDVLNRYASVVSHDLKNPLASMKNIAYYFSNSVKLEGEVPNKMLKMLSSEVDRMNKMIVDLLDLTRIRQFNSVISDLDVLITEAVEKEKSDKIKFDLNLANLKAKVDPEKFKQVILSLVKNSKDAVGSGGGDISINMSQTGGNAAIEITDTGKGMDEQTLEKCFDPMFSTKTAKALGMSLTVSKQIINMSGGSIKAENCPGKGAKFTVTLPLAS